MKYYLDNVKNKRDIFENIQILKYKCYIIS